MIKEEIMKLFQEDGFAHNNNYQIITEDNTFWIKAELNKNSNNIYGIAHGGFIFGLADTAMGIEASLKGKKVVTLNSTISYLKPGKGAYLKAKPEVIKEGHNTCVLNCNIYDDRNQLVAITTGTYYYMEDEKN